MLLYSLIVLFISNTKAQNANYLIRQADMYQEAHEKNQKRIHVIENWIIELSGKQSDAQFVEYFGVLCTTEFGVKCTTDSGAKCTTFFDVF